MALYLLESEDGPSRLRAVLDAHTQRFSRALDAYLYAQRPGEPVERAALVGPLAASAVQRSLDALAFDVPRFVEGYARPEGFIDPDSGRLLDSARPLVQITFRYFQVGLLRLKMSVDAVFTPYERALLRQWQIEHSRAPLEQKLELAWRHRDDLLPHYDTALSAGVLLYRAGRFQEAAEAWRLATMHATLQRDADTLAKLEAWRALLPPSGTQ